MNCKLGSTKKLTLSNSEIAELIEMPIADLKRRADVIRHENIGDNIDLCSIANAKSGKCSEDCKFCAQSGHYNTVIDEYSLLDEKVLMEAARKAKAASAQRFGIVTSGRTLSSAEVGELCRTIKRLRSSSGMEICLSLGTLTEGALRDLREAGAVRYHHNLETSESFYPQVVTTHPYSLRIETVKRAKKVGFQVCSGGIFGLGESWEDRIDLALELKRLKVESVPLNFLVPIKGTPMEDKGPLSNEEALRIVCIYRILIPEATIKVAAGRESVLESAQKEIFLSGCNGMLIGGYLTVRGRTVKEDKALIKEVKQIWARRS